MELVGSIGDVSFEVFLVVVAVGMQGELLAMLQGSGTSCVRVLL